MGLRQQFRTIPIIRTQIARPVAAIPTETAMDLMTIVSHVEQWTATEVHELKAWLDLHVLHRATNPAEAPAQPVVDAPDAPVAEPAPVDPTHTDAA